MCHHDLKWKATKNGRSSGRAFPSWRIVFFFFWQVLWQRKAREQRGEVARVPLSARQGISLEMHRGSLRWWRRRWRRGRAALVRLLWAGLLLSSQLRFLFCWSGDWEAFCLTRTTAFLFLPLLDIVVVVVAALRRAQGNAASAGQTSLTRPVFLPATRTGPLHPPSAGGWSEKKKKMKPKNRERWKPIKKSLWVVPVVLSSTLSPSRSLSEPPENSSSQRCICVVISTPHQYEFHLRSPQRHQKGEYDDGFGISHQRATKRHTHACAFRCVVFLLIFFFWWTISKGCCLFFHCPDHTVANGRFLKSEGWTNEVLNARRADHQLVDVREHHGSTVDRVVVQAGRAHEAFASVAFFVFVILIGVEKLFAKETPLLPRSWGFFGKLHRRGQVSSAFFERVVVPLRLLHDPMCFACCCLSKDQRFSGLNSRKRKIICQRKILLSYVPILPKGSPYLCLAEPYWSPSPAAWWTLILRGQWRGESWSDARCRGREREREAPQPACMERTYQDLKRKVSASRCFGSMLLGTEEIKKPTAPSSTASISNHGSSLVRRYQSQAPMGGCDGQLHPSYTNPLYDRLIPLYSLFPIPSHSNTLRSQSIATKVIRLLLYFGSTVSLNPWYYWLSRSRYNLCQARKASFLK